MLVESQVRLVGDAIGSSGVNDGFVEGKDGAFIQQVFGDFLDVRVESHTEERLLALDVFKEFLFVHIINCIFGL